VVGLKQKIILPVTLGESQQAVDQTAADLEIHPLGFDGPAPPEGNIELLLVSNLLAKLLRTSVNPAHFLDRTATRFDRGSQGQL
jgi:hypothetical protein